MENQDWAAAGRGPRKKLVGAVRSGTRAEVSSTKFVFMCKFFLDGAH